MIGDGVILGGQVGIADNIELVSGVIVVSGASVLKSITLPGIFASGLHAQPANQFRRIHALMKRLPELFSRVKSLEKEHV